ncbi:integrase_H2C2 domain-containing protein [Trichonephila clavipes]|nr:integrase_H2C2 domain-containing protein [Trichonephila clavipes]
MSEMLGIYSRSVGSISLEVAFLLRNPKVDDPIVLYVTTPSTSKSDPWSDESVQKDQLADPEVKPIIEFKELSEEKPSWQDIASFHPTTKRYGALWDSLYLRNGVPFTRPPAFPYPRCSTERNLCLPADLLFSRPPDTPLAPEEYIEKSGNGDGGNTSSG